jgi:hypothetical protein
VWNCRTSTLSDSLEADAGQSQQQELPNIVQQHLPYLLSFTGHIPLLIKILARYAPQLRNNLTEYT